MLTELRVRDLAVIADGRLPLEAGLNVLTGETGAGKSILVDALALLLGERASTEVIRPGAKRAVVEAAFDLRRAEQIESAADEAGLDVDDGVLVVRRDINAEGRNRAWANGSPTTVGVLAMLGRALVDLHGQHEAQSLLRPGTQRDILDAFGGSGEERRRVRECHQQALQYRGQETELLERRDEVIRRADYLRHVVTEIEETDPQPGEDETLAAEAKRLANVEELTRACEELAGVLDDDETSAAAMVGQARRLIERIARIDETAEPWLEQLEAALSQLDDLARAVREYADDVEVEPGRLEEVERRRDRLYRLLQKYGSTIEAVRQTGNGARRELDLLDTAEFELERLAEQREQADRELESAAAALSQKRAMAAGRLAAAVDGLLPALGIPHGRFQSALEPLEVTAADGADRVTFAAQLNPGMDFRPVAQAASGGELSRLMLALKVVLAEHDTVHTLVFDEVDQGVGGETAGKIADALANIARNRQVLVITHLPQIAARASHHVRVTKGEIDGLATTEVEVLTGEAREREVARMLGDSSDAALLQHAKDLLATRATADRR